MKITTRSCPDCGGTSTLEVTPEAWHAWTDPNRTRLIQDIFPEMTIDDRERLMSGICPDCWADITAKEG